MLTLLALPRGASAGERPLVLVVGESGDPLVARIEGELALMGYRAESVARSADWLSVAEARTAVGVVEVDPERDEVVLWTLGSTPNAHLESRSRVASPDPQVLALRTVELLHGRLTPLGEGPPPDDGGERDEPSAAEGARGPRRGGAVPARPSGAAAFPTPFSAFMGASLTGAAGGLPPWLGPRITAGYRPHPSFEVGATALPPPSKPRIEVENGEAEVELFAFGPTLRVGYRLRSFALDGGLALLAVHGVATTRSTLSSFAGARSEGWAWRPELALGATWLATERIGLRAQASVGGIAPELEVLGVDSPSEQHGPKPVAGLRSPVAALTLGIEVGLGKLR